MRTGEHHSTCAAIIANNKAAVVVVDLISYVYIIYNDVHQVLLLYGVLCIYRRVPSQVVHVASVHTTD